MNNIEIFLALFLLTAIAAALAPRFKLPIELILLLSSLAISLIPRLPLVVLQPSIVFTLFLPPILFSAAYFTSWRDFQKNIHAISLLGIGLVLFTSCGVAILIKLLIPTLNWPIGFLLGAIVSPPDASAATAIAKKLGIPRRLVTLIEGESLINDATALITYRFALGAVFTGSFSLGNAGLQFISMTIGGIALGYVISLVSGWLIVKLADDKAQNMLMLAIPFITYLVAEYIEVSGVIATVSAGLFFARKLPMLINAETRHKSEAIWEIFIFIINGLVFTLIGLQLPSIIRGLDAFTRSELLLYAVLCSCVVILIRFIWIFPSAYLLWWLNKSSKIRQRDPIPHWSRLVILSWTGMRGIVSLAAALSIPTLLPTGELFPWRNLIIFLTYCIILSTLIVPALTLPSMIKFFKISDDGLTEKELAKARLTMAQTVLAQLAYYPTKQYSIPEQHLEQTRKHYERRINNLQKNLADIPYSKIFSEEQAIRQFAKELINIERKTLIKLRKQTEIHDEVFYILQHELDIEDLRLRTHRL